MKRIFIFFILAFSFHQCIASTQEITPETEKYLQLLADGVKSGNEKNKAMAIKALEKLANGGDGGAAFNLSAYYSGLLVPEAKDRAKECKWVIKSAQLNYVHGISGAIVCEIKSRGNNLNTLQNYVMPLVYKERALGGNDNSDLIQDYEEMMRNNRNITVGELFEKINSFLER